MFAKSDILTEKSKMEVKMWWSEDAIILNDEPNKFSDTKFKYTGKLISETIMYGSTDAKLEMNE